MGGQLQTYQSTPNTTYSPHLLSAASHFHLQRPVLQACLQFCCSTVERQPTSRFGR